MRRTGAGLVFLLATPLAAAAAVEVRIIRPLPGETAYGLVEVAAQVVADESVAGVDFFVDGRRVARVEEPPYAIEVDVGQENADHEFRVVVQTASGEQAADRLVTAAIRVDESLELRLQQLYVTVTSGPGRTLGLQAGDFRVLDEGKPQAIVTFERGDVPLTAVLLLDGSESMSPELAAAAVRGARAFVAGMRPLDEAKAMLFSDRLLRASPFTDDPEALAQTLASFEGSGGTALNDFLYAALKLLDGRQGRRVVVLFSDGADVHSVLPMREVLEKARRSQALIYWIHLELGGKGEPSFTSSWRSFEANRLEYQLLAEAVRESGGRVEVLERAEELEQAFAGILAELREQYVLGYYPTAVRGDGSWHDVEVKVGRFGADVRTRGGYIDN